MVKVVIVNGMPESGKTTFQETCQHICSMVTVTKVHIMSSVEYVKQVAYDLGWDGTKTNRNRKFLSDLKRALTDWDDVVFKKIKERLYLLDCSEYDYIVFIDIREPSEIERAVKELNATTVLIKRDSVEDREYTNSSDSHVFDYEYDVVIDNNGDLQDLTKSAEEFLYGHIFPSSKIYTKE